MSVTASKSKVKERGDEQVVDMSIVLVCWNNKTYLDPCLKSLFEGGLKSSFDVVVVDNGSTDGSQQMLIDKYPEVQIIQNDRNVGLGKASNQGIEVTKGRHVLLLNNDTLVNGPALECAGRISGRASRRRRSGGEIAELRRFVSIWFRPILDPVGRVSDCDAYR
ncbi:MAG: glycosyltransferase [Anaerolineae bacterium]|nr:glycosyltransferase [Anaerolineae bacterium]